MSLHNDKIFQINLIIEQNLWLLSHPEYKYSLLKVFVIYHPLVEHSANI